MAYVDGSPGEKLAFKFGNGADPEVFSEECTINTDRSLELSSDVFQGFRADCANPSAPARPVRRVKGIDLRFTGAGTASMASASKLIDLWQSGTAFNGKVIQDHAEGFTITGSWIIESITLGGTHGEDQTFSITLAVAKPDFTIALT
jgi:hypothetical protein